MKIDSYKNDESISLNDKVIGTDAEDGKKTKSYTFQKIKDFLIAQGLGNNEEQPVTDTVTVTRVVETTISSSQLIQLYTTPIVILDST